MFNRQKYITKWGLELKAHKIQLKKLASVLNSSVPEMSRLKHRDKVSFKTARKVTNAVNKLCNIELSCEEAWKLYTQEDYSKEIRKELSKDIFEDMFQDGYI